LWREPLKKWRREETPTPASIWRNCSRRVEPVVR
jgi:hypothetical protein